MSFLNRLCCWWTGHIYPVFPEIDALKNVHCTRCNAGPVTVMWRKGQCYVYRG